jgi:hypothetical protein
LFVNLIGALTHALILSPIPTAKSLSMTRTLISIRDLTKSVDSKHTLLAKRLSLTCFDRLTRTSDELVNQITKVARRLFSV